MRFKTGLHLENYAKAWNTSNVSVFFVNLLVYASMSCVLLIVICAPAAYVLSRFTFLENKLIQNGFVAAMGVPVAIDGCPPMKTFWKIMLPMAQPGIITVTIFNFINVWNEYFMSLIFANSDKVKSVAIGLYGMINSMRYTGDYAGMFAAVVIVFLPTFILYVFLSEKIIAGVTGGGVKG